MSIFGALPAQSQRYKYDIRYIRPERLDSEAGPLVLLDLARPHVYNGSKSNIRSGPRRDSDGAIERAPGFLNRHNFGIQSIFLGRPKTIGNQTYQFWDGYNVLNTTSICSIAHHEAHWEVTQSQISDQTRGINTVYGTYADRYVGSYSYASGTSSGTRVEPRNVITGFGPFYPNNGDGDLSNLYDKTSAEIDSIGFTVELRVGMYQSYPSRGYENIKAAQFAGEQANPSDYIGGGEYSSIGDYYLYILNGAHEVYAAGAASVSQEAGAVTNRIVRFRNTSAANKYNIDGHQYNSASSKINKSLLDGLARRFDSYTMPFTFANLYGPTALTSSQEEDENINLTDFKISADGTKVLLLVNKVAPNPYYRDYYNFTRDISINDTVFPGPYSADPVPFIMSGTMSQAFNPSTIVWDTDSNWLFASDLHGFTARGGSMGKFAPGSTVNGHKSHFIRGFPGLKTSGNAYTQIGKSVAVGEYGWSSFDVTPEGDRLIILSSDNNTTQGQYIFQMDLNTPWDLSSYDSWQYDPRQISLDSFNNPEFDFYNVSQDSEEWYYAGSVNYRTQWAAKSYAHPSYNLDMDSAYITLKSNSYSFDSDKLGGYNGPINVKWIRQDPHSGHNLYQDLSPVGSSTSSGISSDLATKGFNPKGYAAIGKLSAGAAGNPADNKIRWSHGGERLLLSSPLGVITYRCDPNFTYQNHRRDWMTDRVSYNSGIQLTSGFVYSDPKDEPSASQFRRAGKVFFGSHSGPGPKPKVR